MNYYELLNIERGADANAVKRAYFSMVKIHSPDKDPQGFKAIRLAYETLSDQKKRGEYDSYFSENLSNKQSDGELQNKLLAAHEMIRENKFKQAEEFLAGLIGVNLDSMDQPDLFLPDYPDVFYTEAKRLLAEVFWHMNKTGTAVKLCDQLLKQNPSDADTLLLRANIAVSMGHKEKAAKYFNDAAQAAPLNARIWIGYMHFAMGHAREKVSDIFKRAMQQNIDMFREDYSLYLLSTQKTNKFSENDCLKYYDKFAEFFLIDKNYDEDTYETLMNLLPRIIDDEKNIPFFKKVLPVLETSRYRNDDDEENFEFLRSYINLHELKSDKRIHDVLVDLTIHLVTKDTDKDEQFGMEYYIVLNLSDLRPSIKILKNEYPELFKLHQAFYFEVLNERKEDHLIEKYIGMYKKLKPALINDDDDDDDFDDDSSGAIITETFIRDAPKIGRNDPCPCGSGKKYKKCCGK